MCVYLVTSGKLTVCICLVTFGKLTVCYGTLPIEMDGLPNLKLVMFYSKLLN